MQPELYHLFLYYFGLFFFLFLFLNSGQRASYSPDFHINVVFSQDLSFVSKLHEVDGFFNELNIC